MAQNFRAIPDPGTTIQSLVFAVQALTEVVQELAGQRANGVRAAQLRVDAAQTLTSLNNQIAVINARLTAGHL